MAIRLLIIEDTAETAKLLQTYLKRFGFDCHWVPDGQQGVNLFAREQFDLVLSDYFMPKLDGLEVAKQIRTLPRGNQVGYAMMSGLFRTTDWKAQAAKQAGVDLFFDKPFVLSDVKKQLLALADKYTGASSDDGNAKSKTPAAPAPKAETADIDQNAPTTPSQLHPVLSVPLRMNEPTDDEDIIIDAGDLSTDAPVDVDGPQVVPQMLVELARARATGVLSLENGSAMADLVFINGVVVDASDNLRENLLGARLVRAGHLQRESLRDVHQRMQEKGERFGEAVLALELCEVEVLLAELAEQAKERIIRVVGWPDGQMQFDSDEELARNRAVEVYNLFEGILVWFARQPDVSSISSWLKENAQSTVHTTPDFEEGLKVYRVLAPSSPLPDELASGPKKIKAVVKSLNKISSSSAMSYALHLYGFWMAGMIVLNMEPTDDRMVPLALGGQEGDSKLLDKEMIALVRREWLRIQGRNLYQMLEVPTHAPRPEVQAALEIYQGRFDPERLKSGNLGPAASIGREVLGRIAEAEATLLNEKKRSQYDQTIHQASGFEAPKVQSEAEIAFFKGRKLLEDGKTQEAHLAFMTAHSLEKKDADYLAYAAWALFLTGGSEGEKGRAMLHRARQLNPNAMRPIFFLGLTALHDGKPELARDFLNEAARRVPNDADVHVALAGLPSPDVPAADEVFDPFK